MEHCTRRFWRRALLGSSIWTLKASSHLKASAPRELTASEWIGRPVYAIGEVGAQLAPQLEAMLAQGTAFERRDVDYARGDGTHVRLRITGSPIASAENGHGESGVRGMLMLLDVTADHERAEALRIQARYDEAGAALRNAALASTDGLAFLEASVALFGRTARADRARALLTVDDDAPLISVTLWTGDARRVPEPIELDPSLWPALRRGKAIRVAPGASPQGDELLRTVGDSMTKAVGCAALVLLPFRDEADRTGIFLLERDAPPPDSDVEETGPWSRHEVLALGRLSSLFDTLWAWIGAESRYRQTVLDLEDGLFNFSYDLDGRRRYAFVTPQFEHLTGCEESDLVVFGSSTSPTVDWSELVHEETQKGLKNMRRRCAPATPVDSSIAFGP